MAKTQLLRLPDDRRFEIIRAGRGDDVLLVHPGGPGLSSPYLSNLLALAGPRRQVVLLHPRGVGRSYRPRSPRSYTVRAMADDVEAVRHALGGRPVDLLGFSAGGFVAIEYAHRHPGGLRSLLLCGTAASAADLRTANRRILAGATPSQRRALRALEKRRAFSTPEYQSLIEEIERPYQSRYLRSPAHALASSQMNFDVYRAMMTRSGNEFVVDGTLARWDGRPSLARVRVPSLVLVGRDDFLYPASKEIARRIPGARFVTLARASHLANLERPREYRAVLRRFLEDVGSGALTPRRPGRRRAPR
ncbi:MAG TPA: alpha/beta hydrolase [Thermoplasmata archaeon]|nr:alpha/beta hydrolase [Thermoplasmata archaeon]